jgi:hypothetical protein
LNIKFKFEHCDEVSRQVADHDLCRRGTQDIRMNYAARGTFRSSPSIFRRPSFLARENYQGCFGRPLGPTSADQDIEDAISLERLTAGSGLDCGESLGQSSFL